MLTSPETEHEEQSRWSLNPGWDGAPVVDALINNEFLDSDLIAQQQATALASIIQFAASDVPYYTELLKTHSLEPADVSDLALLKNLPPLSKQDLLSHEQRLQPPQLPVGEQFQSYTYSSGTTGRSARVAHTVNSRVMYALYRQRELRWFRWNPQASLAWIRVPEQLPEVSNGQLLKNAEAISSQGWWTVKQFFQTGQFYAYSVLNPIQDQIHWLKEVRPDYLVSYSESLEHLAFAMQGQPINDNLAAVQAISEQLTGDMRNRIETAFSAPVMQNYGLNEVGLVAGKCMEGGRYHIHAEHCIVEIVDEHNQPVAAGEVGRLLVTALTNPAMPLLRYDTDDLATAVSGPCPCGRTLPSFGNIIGRYSRIAFLPEGTLGLVGAIRESFSAMPLDMIAPLRRFQLHQYRGGHFQLRLQLSQALHQDFRRHVENAWQQACESRAIQLEIVRVADISSGKGGKFQEFTSEFMPKSDHSDESQP